MSAELVCPNCLRAPSGWKCSAPPVCLDCGHRMSEEDFVRQGGRGEDPAIALPLAQLPESGDEIAVYDVAKLREGQYGNEVKLDNTFIVSDDSKAPPFELFIRVNEDGTRSLEAVRCNLIDYVIVPRSFLPHMPIGMFLPQFQPPA